MIKIKQGFYFIGIMWFILLVDTIRGDNTDIGFFLVWSVMSLVMILYVLIPLNSYQIRYKKYGRAFPFENRERMKYITELSCNKVAATLQQYQNTYGIFEYKFEMEEEGVFILTIDEIRQAYVYCGGRVKYKVFFTPEPEGCAMWICLLESKSRSAESRYAWEMKGFFEEKINAVRVE